jgi:hypothetical protein
MGIINPSISYGQTIFETAISGFSGFSGFRAKDDAADPKDITNAYSHQNATASATEATEIIGLLQFIIQQAVTGGGALAVTNQTGFTIPVGPIVVTGYDETLLCFKIAAASNTSSTPGAFLLLAELATATQGVAYIGGVAQTTLDTSLATIGDPIYTDWSGMTLSTPSGFSGFSGAGVNSYQQVVGRVVNTGVSGTMQGFVEPLNKINGAQIQEGSIGNIHYRPWENVNTPVYAGPPPAGRNGDCAIDSVNNRFYVKYGNTWHYCALT